MKMDFLVRGARRFLRFRVGWVVAGIIVTTVLAYWVENWRGRRAWVRYVQETNAQGFPVAWEACIPPAVPDAENFAMTPLFAQLYGLYPESRVTVSITTQISAILGCFRSNRIDFLVGKWMAGQPVSLVACWTNQLILIEKRPRMNPAILRRYGLTRADVEKASASDQARDDEVNARIIKLIAERSGLTSRQQAESLLALLQPLEPVWEELRAAMVHPRCRYPVNYDMRPLDAIQVPHVGVIGYLAQFLRLSAVCHLELGQTDAALQNLELGFYLANSLKTDPGMYSYSERSAATHLLTQAIWEGVAKHQWSASQLERLQKLRPLGNEVAEYHRILLCYRAKELGSVNERRKQRQTSWRDFWRSSLSMEFIQSVFYFDFGPRGWMDWEKLRLCQRFDEFLPQTLDISVGRICTNELLRFSKLWDAPEDLLANHGVLADLCGAQIYRGIEWVSRMQAAADLAFLGCALERYWLEQKTYPVSLSELAPQYAEHVPIDILTGEPYRYKWEGKDAYGLFATRIGRKDESVISYYDPRSYLRINIEGDWIWRGGSQDKPATAPASGF